MIGKQDPELLSTIRESLKSSEKTRQKQRFEYSLQLLLGGQSQTLHNSEFVEAIIALFIAPLDENRTLDRSLIRVLAEAGGVADNAVRLRAVTLLSLFVSGHLEEMDDGLRDCIVNGYCSWLNVETELFSEFEAIQKSFEQFVAWSIDRQYWDSAVLGVRCLKAFIKNDSGKPTTLRNIASRSLKKISAKERLEWLTELYLTQEENREQLFELLLLFDEPAARVLLKRLIGSRARNERLVLIDALGAFSCSSIKPLLNACLDAAPPWAVIRNIIAVAGLIGDDSLYSLVQKVIDFPDERVQLEAVKTIMKIGGEHCNLRLVEVITHVHDRIKLYVIRLLVERQERSQLFYLKVIELIKNRNSFEAKTKSHLLTSLVASLKFFPSVESEEALKELLHDCRSENDMQQLRGFVADSLASMKPQIRRLLHVQHGGQNDIAFDTDPVAKQFAFEKAGKIETKVRSLLSKNLVHEAGMLLFAEGTKAALARDFVTAEMLRDRLLVVDPRALDKVIELGEIIEREGASPVSSQYLEIWRDLHQALGDEEFNALQYVLKNYQFPGGVTMVKSGETDNHLYFLNSGFVNISSRSGEREVFLKKVQPGEILGGEQFFSPSVWTVTLTTHTPVELQVLHEPDFHQLSSRFDGFGKRLQRFCENGIAVGQLIQTSGADRREFPRYEARLALENVLYDFFGMKSRRQFRGELQDISRKGYAFMVRVADEFNIRMLLGRRIVSTARLENIQMPSIHGIVVGIHCRNTQTQDYCIHVKLESHLSEETLTLIKGSKKQI